MQFLFGVRAMRVDGDAYVGSSEATDDTFENDLNQLTERDLDDLLDKLRGLVAEHKAIKLAYERLPRP